MAAIVSIGPDADRRVRVCPAPLVEAVLALHTLVEPGHHPEQHPFVRRMRALPPSFRAELDRLRETFRSPSEGLINPHPDPTAGIDDLLAALHAADLEPGVADLVGAFWGLAFAEEWDRSRDRLASAAQTMAAAIAADGLLDLLDRVAPWIAVLPARHEVRFSCTADEDADPPASTAVFDARSLPITVVPSLFAAPHVYVDVETPAALQFAVPVHGLVRDDAPPADLVGSLLACGSDARLRLLRALADRPRTVQELAPMLSMAPSTVSRHLGVLAEQGLVGSERDGWYVLYHLRRARVRDVLRDLARYVDAEDDSQSLRSRT
jgi:DNA-binding transcriptional ArsR family regulator